MKAAPHPEQGQMVLRYLKVKATGRNHAIQARDLARALGISERTIRAVVHELRCVGVPIASAVNGFYIPEDFTEADVCSRHLWARVTQIAQAARAFDRAAADKLGLRRGQAEQIQLIFGEEDQDGA